MPIPDFVLELRRKVGQAQLWLPGITAVVCRGDEVLLVRRSDNGQWAPITGSVAHGVGCLTLNTTSATALRPANGARSSAAVFVSPAASFPASAIRGRHEILAAGGRSASWFDGVD